MLLFRNRFFLLLGVLILILYAIWHQFIQPPIFDCPIRPLKTVELTEKSEKSIFEVATELDASLDILKKNITVDGIQAGFRGALTTEISERELSVLGGDSIFVGYYNAYAGLVCFQWQHYQAQPSPNSKESLAQSITTLQSFIEQYYANYSHAQESAEQVDQIGKLLLLIISLKRQLDEVYHSTLPSEMIIRHDNFQAKLDFFKSRLVDLDQKHLGASDFFKIEEVRTHLDELRPRILEFIHLSNNLP